MTVNYETYENEKLAFFRKHEMDYVQNTSEMSAGMYHKEYVFSDGAIFYESMMKVEEEQIIEAHEIKTKVTVSYMKTEYWTNENCGTNTVYENW